MKTTSKRKLQTSAILRFLGTCLLSSFFLFADTVVMINRCELDLITLSLLDCVFFSKLILYHGNMF